MLSIHLTKCFARVVLATYMTQLMVPIAKASEGGVDILPAINHFAKDNFRESSPPREAILEDPLQKPHWKNLSPSLDSKSLPLNEDQAFLQAETYQYRLSVKTPNSENEKYQFKLSRKQKESKGSFERLHTAIINQGHLITTYSKKNETNDDVLLNLFRNCNIVGCIFIFYGIC